MTCIFMAYHAELQCLEHLCDKAMNRSMKISEYRNEIKADVKKQHDLYVDNLVGDI